MQVRKVKDCHIRQDLYRRVNAIQVHRRGKFPNAV